MSMPGTIPGLAAILAADITGGGRRDPRFGRYGPPSLLASPRKAGVPETTGEAYRFIERSLSWMRAWPMAVLRRCMASAEPPRSGRAYMTMRR